MHRSKMSCCMATMRARPARWSQNDDNEERHQPGKRMSNLTHPWLKVIGKTKWDWRILLNGRVDELAYENELLNQSLPFETLRYGSIINERAKALDQSPDFSILIRRGLPGMGD